MCHVHYLVSSAYIKQRPDPKHVNHSWGDFWILENPLRLGFGLDEQLGANPAAEVSYASNKPVGIFSPE